MTSVVEEKATLFISRFANTFTSYNLEKDLFPSISGQDIVEIYGESGSGKTELLYHFIAQCILPKLWKNLDLGGSELKVIFIDNDCHFNLFRLISILETRLKTFLKQHSIKVTSDDIDIFIKSRIKLLEIIKCLDSEQFLMTLYSLEAMLSTKSSETVMMIDGMTSFYWSDKMRTQSQYKNLLTLYFQTVSVATKISQSYKIPIFATRRRVINCLNSDRKILGQSWKNAVTWSLELSFVCPKPDHTLLSLFNVNTNETLRCGIKKSGFTFMGNNDTSNIR